MARHAGDPAPLGDQVRGPDHHLGGDAPPVRALATDQPALHPGHRQPGLGQRARRVLTPWSHADDDNIDVSPTFAQFPSPGVSTQRPRVRQRGMSGPAGRFLGSTGDRPRDGAKLMTSSRPDLAQPTGPADGPGMEPLTESDAEEHIHGICFKTGPPRRVGVELEWLVRDDRDPGIRVDQQRVAAALAGLGAPGALPGGGRLTTEPGGQVEISSAPAEGLAPCVDITRRDLAALRHAVLPAGLCLTGEGLDPLRSPHRVLEVPRYAAMEEFFNRAGPWGRLMMCSTASVQVCLDAGVQGTGPASVGWRWRLLHALGPVFVAAFANSPLREGRPTGWKSTRQAIWARLDPCRTRPPQNAVPAGRGHRQTLDADPRAAWIDYALSAEVMCVRRPGGRALDRTGGADVPRLAARRRRAAAHPGGPLLPPVHAVPAGPAARPPGVPGHRRPGWRRVDRAGRRGHGTARR